ncbi:30S ribosomal protein S13 [Candidatus Woesearchaeota archaeon]|nr:30S ribosomal protein S13 [Candidatus Woesearchaeota archaeon]
MTENKENKDYRHLVRVANTDIEGTRPIGYGLRKIKGVGFHLADSVCNINGIDKNKKAGDLTDEEVKKLDDAVKNPRKYNIPVWMVNRRKDPESGEDKHLIMGDMDFVQDNDIKLMKKIKSYRGIRHMSGLPVRGQRTKANFRKSKGKVTGVKKKGKKGKV